VSPYAFFIAALYFVETYSFLIVLTTALEKGAAAAALALIMKFRRRVARNMDWHHQRRA